MAFDACSFFVSRSLRKVKHFACELLKMRPYQFPIRLEEAINESHVMALMDVHNVSDQIMSEKMVRFDGQFKIQHSIEVK